MSNSTATTTYTAQRPEVPAPTGNEAERVEVLVSGRTIDDRPGDSVYFERYRKPHGDKAGSHAVPPCISEPSNEHPLGERYWPIFVRSDGATPHPAVVAHDLASGEAELLTDEDEVVRIINEVQLAAGGLGFDGECSLESYFRCITASVRGSRVRRSKRLASLLNEGTYDAAPDGPDGDDAWLVPIDEVAELLHRPVQFVKNASGSDLPKPIVIRRQWFYNSKALARCLAP